MPMTAFLVQPTEMDFFT